MKQCHFKSEHSTAGVLCTTNEALEAIIDDSAEVMSAARAVTSHKSLVGKTTGMSGAPRWWKQARWEGQELCPAPLAHRCPSASLPGLFKAHLVGAK